MFGNTLGWLISAAISVAAAVLGWKIVGGAAPTAPTGWVTTAVHPLGLADVAQTVLPPRLNVKDDAGDYYRDAIADYNAHKTLYEQLTTTKDFDEAEESQMKGLDAVVKAADCQTMNLFSKNPGQIINSEASVQPLDDLVAVSKAMSNAIALAKFEKQYDLATKYSNALLALGFNLYRERLAYMELEAGETMMGTGARALQGIYGAAKFPAKAEAMQHFDDARKTEFTENIMPVWTVIGGQDSGTIGKYAGDMFELAGDPKADRLWRIEAMHKVGRLQFNAENRADQLKTPRFLDQIGSDPKEDPSVKVAATVARNMTDRDNQSQR